MLAGGWVCWLENRFVGWRIGLLVEGHVYWLEDRFVGWKIGLLVGNLIVR